MPAIKHYFVTSHTAHGFVNYLSPNIEGFQVFLLSHPSLTIKTKVLQQLVDFFIEKKVSIEVLISGHSKEYYDGVILRDRSLALIADHAVHEQIDVKQTFTFDLSIDMNETTNKQVEIKDKFSEAHNYIAESLAAHKQIEKFYIQKMNFNRSNEIIDQVKQQLFVKNRPYSLRESKVYRRLFGSNTIHGNYNVVSQLLPLVERRIFIQGGPGTGKSVFMKEMIKQCLTDRYNVEQYMCSFDPTSTDMIIIPELKICMLDNTGSHAFSPLSDQDIVIDLYKEAGAGNVEKEHEEAITNIQSIQKEARQRGRTLMKEAGQMMEHLEQSLISEVPKSEIDDKVLEILHVLP